MERTKREGKGERPDLPFFDFVSEQASFHLTFLSSTLLSAALSLSLSRFNLPIAFFSLAETA
jgi:hypothetical protein